MAAKSLPDELKNCPACKKLVKKAKRFYRDGKYFCNPNCWRAFKIKAAEAAAEAAAGTASE